MHRSKAKTVHRGLVVAAAAVGLWTLGTGGAQADDGGQGTGKVIEHATKEAGKAVSTAPSASAPEDLGAVSVVQAASAAPSASGLPEDLVIEIPELLPGVPSIGILPLSLPPLPVTPTIPFI